MYCVTLSPSQHVRVKLVSLALSIETVFRKDWFLYIAYLVSPQKAKS